MLSLIVDNLIYNILNLDVWFLQTFVGKNYFQILKVFLIDLWLWVPLLILFIRYVILELWIYTRQIAFGKTLDPILLAIDVPRKNEQSIAAMELVFTQILGAHKTQNFVEKWWIGEYQPAFSCEIVSIDGYIQLLMRVPSAWRDLVEGAIFGQFPDAEITQVNDYVDTVPSTYPNPTHDMWGVEWSMDNTKNPYMPIKTYTEFQDSFTQLFTDPLAGLLEAMSKIGEGEQIWVHFLCKPLGVDWAKDSPQLINDILGRPNDKKRGILSKISELPSKLVNDITEELVAVRALPETVEEGAQDDAFGKMWKMSPGERNDLEAMQRKISKLAYGVKLRYGYFYEHGKGAKTRGLNPIMGAIKQFNYIGRNGFKPEIKKTGTKAEYFRVAQRKAYRQNKITSALKGRSTTKGLAKMKINTEELATLFHFPSMDIKAPMLKKAEMVKAEAPINLPFETQSEESEKEVIKEKRKIELPEVTEKFTPHFDYDSDEFERRFAVDKKAFEESRPAREKRLKEIALEDEKKSEISANLDIPPKKVIDENKFKYAKDTDKVVVKPVVSSSNEAVSSKIVSSNKESISSKEANAVGKTDKSNDYEFEVLHAFTGKKAEIKKDKDKNEDKGDTPSNLPFV